LLLLQHVAAVCGQHQKVHIVLAEEITMVLH